MSDDESSGYSDDDVTDSGSESEYDEAGPSSPKRRRVSGPETSSVEAKFFAASAISDNAVYVWDLTTPLTQVSGFDAFKAMLKEHCKSWTFQEELYSNGMHHYQCRVSLRKKVRNPQDLIPGNWSPTTKKMMNDMSHYVTKLDTRVAGPWSDKDELQELPDDWLEGLEEPRPFQQSILDMIRGKPDRRAVNLLYDPKGNSGKSEVYSFAKAQIKNVISLETSAVNGRELILDVASTLKQYPTHVRYKQPFTFLIDIPRADRHLPVYYWSSIERIKSGSIRETRYKSDEVLFMKPHIWVFTNTIPDKSLLTNDRWNIFCINEKQELIKYREK